MQQPATQTQRALQHGLNVDPACRRIGSATVSVALTVEIETQGFRPALNKCSAIVLAQAGQEILQPYEFA